MDLNFPPKIIFANNSKTIDWKSTLSNIHWLNFFVLKDIQNISVRLIDFEIKIKTIIANWGLSQISMDFVFWVTCTSRE